MKNTPEYQLAEEAVEFREEIIDFSTLEDTPEMIDYEWEHATLEDKVLIVLNNPEADASITEWGKVKDRELFEATIYSCTAHSYTSNRDRLNPVFHDTAKVTKQIVYEDPDAEENEELTKARAAELFDKTVDVISFSHDDVLDELDLPEGTFAVRLIRLFDGGLHLDFSVTLRRSLIALYMEEQAERLM